MAIDYKNYTPSSDEIVAIVDAARAKWKSDEDIYNALVSKWWINRDEEMEKSFSDNKQYAANNDSPINWIEDLTQGYSEEDLDKNKQLLNNIKRDSNLSLEQKTKALKDLSEKAKASNKKRNENLPYDMEQLSEISKKNKATSNLSKDATSSIYNKVSQLTNKWMTKDKSDKLLNEIKQIYSDGDIDDKTKKKKIQYIIDKAWWDNWNAAIDRAYSKYSNIDDKSLTDEQRSEKQMLAWYKKNFDNFKSKANTYVDWLDADVGKWSQTRYNFLTDLWF